MAKTLLAIDLGNYSVKIACIEAGMKGAKLICLEKKIIATNSEQETVSEDKERKNAAIHALRELLEENDLHPEQIVSGVSLEVVVQKTHFPFLDARKVEQVLPFELENSLIGKIEEQVFDWIQFETKEEKTDKKKSQILAVIGEKKKLQQHISLLKEVDAEPKQISLSSIAAATFFLEQNFQKGDFREQERYGLIIDVGHKNTHLCLVDNVSKELIAVYTLERGGALWTKKIAKALNIDLPSAEIIKHNVTLADDLNMQSIENLTREIKISTEQVNQAISILKQETSLWVREIYRVLMVWRSLYGKVPALAALSGGSANLAGLKSMLELELGFTTQFMLMPKEITGALGRYLLKDTTGSTYKNEQELSEYIPVLGLAFQALRAHPIINLRKGSLRYHNNFDAIRHRMGSLFLLLIGLFFSGGLLGYSSFQFMKKKDIELSRLIRQSSKEIFKETPKQGLDVENQLRILNAKQKDLEAGKLIPTATAFDLLDDVSEIILQLEEKNPSFKKLSLEEVVIGDHRMNIQGKVLSVQDVSILREKFEEWSKKRPCFKSVEVGNTVSINIGDEKGYRFYLTFTDISSCL